MKRVIARAAAIVICTVIVICTLPIAITGCSERRDYVHVRTWNTEAAPDLYPEVTDESLSSSHLADRPSFGISFSGGGTRSATATLGALRALDTLGWIDQARYIAANSGGTWVTVPYTYLSGSFTDEEFLGEYLSPDEIRDETLKSEGSEQSMAAHIYRARLVDLNNPSRLLVPKDLDEAYANLVGKIFLEPYQLHDREKFFTLDKNSLARILEGNPKLRESDFYIVERPRPFLIVVGTLLARQRDAPVEERYLFEVTPLYAGTRQLSSVTVEGDRMRKRWIGGGYVEPFGYDSYTPEEPPKDGRWRVRLKGRKRAGDLPTNVRYRFTLSDAIGMSSAAPLVRLTDMKFPNILFPEFRHWSVARADGSSIVEAKELQHGDGGDIDNLAVLPLLARGVKNILVFVNTSKPFSPPEAAPCESTTTDTMVDDVVSLFKPTEKLPFNTVFANGEMELDNLCQAFRERRAAKAPLVHCQSYAVKENERQSVRPYRPNLCWVYLDRVESWIRAIPEADEGSLTGRLTAEDVKARGKFDSFPHYRTFAEHKAVIDLDRERVHALSNLTAWTVFESADYIASHFSGVTLQVD